MRKTQSVLALLALVACSYATPASLAQCPGPCVADLDGDGRVALSDLATLLSYYPSDCAQAWEPDEHTVALWYLNGNGKDFSNNVPSNDLTIKADRVGWVDDAPHCRGVLMGVDPGDLSGCPDNGALRASGENCFYPDTRDWTVEALVYFPSNSATYTIVAQAGQGPNDVSPYALRVENGTAIFAIEDAGHNTALVSADVSGLCGQWFSLTGVYRYQQDTALWVNGALVASAPTTVVPASEPNESVYVGGTYCRTSTGLKLDELRLSSVARGPGGYLLASSYGEDAIRRFNALTGTCVDKFVQGCGQPRGLAIGPDGNLYVARGDVDQVWRYDGNTGADPMPFTHGCPLRDPTGLRFGPDGNLYVISYDDHGYVARFDGQTGACMGSDPNDPNSPFTWGAECNSAGDLAFGLNGNLYVTNTVNDNVQMFDGGSGQYLDVPIPSDPNYAPHHPNGLTFGPDGRWYVCSGVTDSIMVYGATGDFEEEISGCGLDNPTFLSFGPELYLYVSSAATNQVIRYHIGTGECSVFAGGCDLQGPRGLVFQIDGP